MLSSPTLPQTLKEMATLAPPGPLDRGEQSPPQTKNMNTFWLLLEPPLTSFSDEFKMHAEKFNVVYQTLIAAHTTSLTKSLLTLENPSV